MNEERQDLSLLDLPTDRVERMVSNIMERSQLELRRRQHAAAAAPRFGLFDGLLAFSRPALATAAMLALVSLVALQQVESDESTDQTFIWSANLPAPVEVWLEEGQPPTMLDMIVLGGEEN